MALHATLSGHVILLCVPAWGHLRPLSAFACKIVKERPDIAVTLLMVGDLGARVEREIARYFSGSQATLKENIRLVNLGGKGFEPFELMPTIFTEFQGYYQKLINCEPVQCRATGKTFDAVCKPTAAIIDFFLLGILQIIRSMSGKSVPVLAWASANASVSLRIMGPEKFGGMGDVVVKARTEAKATGRKVEDIIEKLYRPSGGKLVTVPGLPPMYDYEWSPQEPLTEVPHNDLFSTAYSFARECDGFVATTSTTYEPESVEALRTWLAETNRLFYVIGPLLPPGVGDVGLSDIAKQKEIDSSENGKEFQVFLDKALKKYGKKSVIYVSFGSFFWPNKNEYVWVLVDALLELGFPFILSHPSPKAIIPPGYADKIKESGIGLMSAWSPQQTILNHPATGWFLTHCGQNSVTEALAQGIPMITWPMDADQPANAAYLTLILDVAFEMIEVRTGYGLKPLHRGVQPAGTAEAVAAEARNVLQRARGPEGERKRKNAMFQRDQLKGEWEEGGKALKDLRKFLTDVSLGN